MNKRISFKQFIYTYNFRYVNQLRSQDYDNDTCIIRIYPPTNDFYKNNWFEFGIYDFSEKEVMWKMCQEIFTKDILESYIDSICYNEDYNVVVTLYLTKESEINER